MKSLFHIFPIKSRLFPLNPVYSPALGILFDGFISVSFLDTADKKMCEALKICGTVSGRDEDKAARAGLTPIFHDNTVIGFEEAKLTVSCRKLYRSQFDMDLFLDPQVIIDCYPKKDFHYVYFCEIRDAYFRSK